MVFTVLKVGTLEQIAQYGTAGQAFVVFIVCKNGI